MHGITTGSAAEGKLDIRGLKSDNRGCQADAMPEYEYASTHEETYASIKECPCTGLRARPPSAEVGSGAWGVMQSLINDGSPDKNAHPTLKHLSGHSVRARVSGESPE